MLTVRSGKSIMICSYCLGEHEHHLYNTAYIEWCKKHGQQHKLKFTYWRWWVMELVKVLFRLQLSKLAIIVRKIVKDND